MPQNLNRSFAALSTNWKDADEDETARAVLALVAAGAR